MTDHELIAHMLASYSGQAFHAVEWIDGEATRSKWIPTDEPRRFAWLMRSQLAERFDLKLCAVPYLHSGSYGLQDRGSCLWVRTTTGDSVKRLARFKPLPTLVLREGKTNRHTAFWALSAGLSPEDIERANRRLSVALDTKAGDCEPGFRFHPPGTILRHGRSRPIVVTTLERTDELYPVTITKGLKDRPKPDPSKWGGPPL